MCVWVEVPVELYMYYGRVFRFGACVCALVCICVRNLCVRYRRGRVICACSSVCMSVCVCVCGGVRVCGWICDCVYTARVCIWKQDARTQTQKFCT